MAYLFFVMSSLPGLAINFGLGNIPSRYFSFILLFLAIKISRKDSFFLFLPIVALYYPLITFPLRSFHLLDLSYFLGFLYLILGVVIVRKNPEIFKKFIFLFWLFNVFYAVGQNFILILSSGDLQQIALMHQNTHSVEYVIPEVGFIPYLYRVTGLFIESAPFVIYLMFTHFAFVTMGFKNKWRAFNLIFIFLAGAKIGLVFLIMLLLSRLPLIKRFNFMHLLFGLGFVAILFLPIINSFISGNLDFYLASISLRLYGFMSVFENFISNWQYFFIGSGYVSSTDIMQGKVIGFERGIDFFSTFVIANGIFGTSIFLVPIVLWFKKNKVLDKVNRNLFFIVLFLAFLVIGALLNFQYSYLLFILAYLSQKSSVERDTM